MEPGHPAADRLLRELEGSRGGRVLRQRLQAAMGAVSQARGGRGRIPLEPARRREGRAARRARPEELAGPALAEGPRNQGMKLKPLGEFGVEAEGVELAALNESSFRQLEKAFFEGQILVVRGQKLSATQFLQFGRRFGPPEAHVIDQFHHPEHADILVLSNVKKNGEPTGLADAGTYFHTDYSYLDVPTRATLLYSIEVPKKGGDTLFANQYGAYDDLPQSKKKQLANLVALHHYGNRDDLDERSRTVASVL